MKKFLLPLIGVCILSSANAEHSNNGTSDNEAKASVTNDRSIYMVKVERDSVLSYQGGIQGIEATAPKMGNKINMDDPNVQMLVKDSEEMHSEILRSVGADTEDKIYSYNYAANGFAARLNERQVAALRNRADVVVFKDKRMKPQTNNSPKFIGLSDKGQAWTRGWTGEDVIVGIIDTGIHPEHPSFADVATPVRGWRGKKIEYSAPPSRWTGSGCAFGNAEFNVLDVEFTCNNKLLKAAYFVKGFGKDKLIASEFLSARDSDGHGSHVAGTAAGNYGVPAQINGKMLGNVSGIAPRARIAAYKVCWQDKDDGGCMSSDSMAAIDQAVADGVDVINFSIGGSSILFNGVDDVAFFDAANAGVHVATSQGNDGPLPDTTGTPSGVPWLTSVGASQDDQVFATAVEVAAPLALARQYLAIEGTGPVSLEDTGVLSGELALAIPELACEALTNPEEVKGKLVLVKRGGCNFSIKYQEAEKAGARALIVYNDGAAADRLYPFVMGSIDDKVTIPGVMIGFEHGTALAASAEVVTASLDPAIKVPQIDRIAEFSSRGPNGGAFDIIKPDITAPGVKILAAGTPSPNAKSKSGLFANLNGTSMSSPHVAGLLALIKQAHPDWSPAMARSALMTTARQDLRKSFIDASADPFDIGAGMVQANKAFNPGLVYDARKEDYEAFSCGNNIPLVGPDVCAALIAQGYSTDGSELNLPSIGIGHLINSQVVKRTVTSVAKGTRLFTVDFEAPAGIEMDVWPKRLKLTEGESADYFVSFNVTDDTVYKAWAFGSVTWSWGGNRYFVRSPVAVRPLALAVGSYVESTNATDSLKIPLTYGYNGPFYVEMEGLVKGEERLNTVEDKGKVAENFTIPEGTLSLRFALFQEDVGDGNSSNDLDLVVSILQEDNKYRELKRAERGGSNEAVNFFAPEPGEYRVEVVDYSTTEGPTDFTLFGFVSNGSDQGNVEINAARDAVANLEDYVGISWQNLDLESRYLGFLLYFSDDGFITETEVEVNTRSTQ